MVQPCREYARVSQTTERSMTETQEQQRLYALAISGGVCEACKKELTGRQPQGAHRIANTQANRAKWGALIIDHPLNIAIVCSLKCNHACNIGNNPGESLKLAQKIIEKELLKFPTEAK